MRWANHAYPVYDKFRSEESKKFEKLHPEVTVRYEPIPGDFTAKILTQIAGKTAPDVFVAGELQEFISRNILLDLTDWVKRDAGTFKDTWPQLMKALEWEGRYYALPGNCNVDMLYYNRDIFDKAKLAYPNEDWTWDDMVAAAQKLTRRGPGGQVEQFGLVLSLDPSYLLLFVSQNGGRLWNDKKDRCIINSPEAIEALRFLQNLIQKYKVAPSPAYTQQHGTSEIFIMGKAAMYLGNSWEVATFKIRNKSGQVLNWDATLPPHPAGRPKYTGLAYQSLGVWSGSKNPELGYQLIKFMTQPERTRFLVEVGDSLPLHKKGEDMDYYLSDPNRPENAKNEMLKALKYAHSHYREHLNPLVPSTQQRNIIQNGMERLIGGLATPEEVAKEIADRLNEILASRRWEKKG